MEDPVLANSGRVEPGDKTEWPNNISLDLLLMRMLSFLARGD